VTVSTVFVVKEGSKLTICEIITSPILAGLTYIEAAGEEKRAKSSESRCSGKKLA